MCGPDLSPALRGSPDLSTAARAPLPRGLAFGLAPGLRLLGVALALGGCRAPSGKGGEDDRADTGPTEDDGGAGAGGGAGAADGADGGADGGSTDGGSADGGSADGGSADGGSTDGGADDPVDVTDPATGRRWRFVSEHLDWPTAAAGCAAAGGALATLRGPDEDAALWELAFPGEDGAGLLNAHTWLGYHAPPDGAWAWQSGEAPGYENFGGEVITDEWGTPTLGQAAAYGDASDPRWIQAPQSWRYASVCELP